MQQTFSAGQEPRVSLGRVEGDLKISGWDRREISIKWDGGSGDLYQEGSLVRLAHCSGDAVLQVPYDAEVRVEESVGGDVEAQRIGRIELRNVGGDVELENIGGDATLENISEAVLITDMGGDLVVKQAPSVRTRQKVGGDATLEGVPLVEMETVGGDANLEDVGAVSIGVVGGDLEIDEISQALRCGSVGGDCNISSSDDAEINLGNVGGDFQLAGAAQLHLGNIGGDGEINNVQGAVQLGNIGGDAGINKVNGEVSVGRIGADAQLRGLAASIRIGGVGADLMLEANFPPGSRTNVHVGGDAVVVLPADANLELLTTVGGSISGPSLSFNSDGNVVRLVYGEGSAHLNLSVGGDLAMRGGGNPQISSSSMPWGEFGKEMSELGQEMAQLGEELGREFSGMFSDVGWAGAYWANDVTRKMEEQVRKAQRKAEQSARKAEERARQAAERARRSQQQHSDRIYVRVNEREWQMNPDRLNDLVGRAQQAAMEGVAGAMEAVERAIGNLRVPRPPRPPRPPYPPTGVPQPPVPPVPSASPVPPMPPVVMPPRSEVPTPPTSSTTADLSASQQGPVEEPSLEQEREAILRMIAEGRITPEEGDMLLEGLGG